jgi:hypothetical protein
MLVQSYSQVADLASNERKYARATDCFEKLLTCLRARAVKTETVLKLMQKASQEIITIRLQQIGSEPSREIRRIHAKHDPHKSIHQKMPALFRKVVSIVSTESPGAYFDVLVAKANVHENAATRLAEKSSGQKALSKMTSPEELEAERELACLVELSDAV